MHNLNCSVHPVDLSCIPVQLSCLALWSIDSHGDTSLWTEEGDWRINKDLDVNQLPIGQWNRDRYGDNTNTSCGWFNIDLHTSLPITCMMGTIIAQVYITFPA